MPDTCPDTRDVQRAHQRHCRGRPRHGKAAQRGTEPAAPRENGGSQAAGAGNWDRQGLSSSSQGNAKVPSSHSKEDPRGGTLGPVLKGETRAPAWGTRDGGRVSTGVKPGVVPGSPLGPRGQALKGLERHARRASTWPPGSRGCPRAGEAWGRGWGKRTSPARPEEMLTRLGRGDVRPSPERRPESDVYRSSASKERTGTVSRSRPRGH